MNMGDTRLVIIIIILVCNLFFRNFVVGNRKETEQKYGG